MTVAEAHEHEQQSLSLRLRGVYAHLDGCRHLQLQRFQRRRQACQQLLDLRPSSQAVVWQFVRKLPSPCHFQMQPWGCKATRWTTG